MHDSTPVDEFTEDLDDPKPMSTIVIGIASVILLIAILWFLEALYYRTAFNEEERKTAGVPMSLRQARVDQLEQISGYTIDDAGQQVTIPIERAMELVVEEARAGGGGRP